MIIITLTLLMIYNYTRLHFSIFFREMFENIITNIATPMIKSKNKSKLVYTPFYNGTPKAMIQHVHTLGE